jgi:hypothetical protein
MIKGWLKEVLLQGHTKLENSIEITKKPLVPGYAVQGKSHGMN